MKRRTLARMIDHTLLKPGATPAQVEALCDEAREYHFASVCVNPTFVTQVAKALAETDVEVCTVVGFPLGATTTAAKVCETEIAIAQGATEIDMVLPIGRLKAGEDAAVRADIAAVAAVCHAHGALLKVIIEAALLTDDEKVRACTLAKEARADFVKTSTGFAAGGATVEDVALMRETVGPEMGVKAAGGIHTYAEALAMIEAGATRIGASRGVAIVEDAPE
ncbi:MAG: deoxyribose-phosphate aldolase [Anaerolineae bacterium]